MPSGSVQSDNDLDSQPPPVKKLRVSDSERAEEFAVTLDGSSASAGEIVQLFDFLHKGAAPRGSDVRGQSFSAGCCVHGGVVGLHNATRAFPASVQVVCDYIKRFSGGYPFAAFTILDQTQSDLHQDTNNDPETWNLIIPLTVFQGGGVWYEAESGPVPCPLDPQRSGYVLNVSEGPQWLPAATAILNKCGFHLQKAVQTAEHVFHQVPEHLCVEDLLVIELFSSDANLCWACHRLGFQVMPIAQSRLCISLISQMKMLFKALSS